MTLPSPEPIGTHVSQWGEGPLWHRDRLFYVDIEGRKILSYDPATQQEKILDAGERVGTVVVRESGGLVFAGDNGFSFLDEATGKVTPITDPEAHIPDNRFNDGKCDPAGRFWAGTMPLGPRNPVGSLYCLGSGLRVSKMFSNVTVSNGLVWTSDARTMFYIDSPRRNVLAFDFDNASGDISNERIAFDVSNHEGVPDGMAIDAQDRLWIAFCHGSAVRCFDSKKNFRCEAELRFPCTEVTACAFGGPDMSDLYVTTGISSKHREPLAGRLFVAHIGVKGASFATFAG
jgi:sugar lactone lactonase YvrE